MKDTDYAAKPVFVSNFWTCFRALLKAGNKALLQDFKKCDFTLIAEYLQEQNVIKKAMTKEASPRRTRPACAAEMRPNRQEKLLAKAARDAAELPYLTCTMDGRVEKARSTACRFEFATSRSPRAAALQVSNFRIEPPGLFRGRGAHPKMGLIKARPDVNAGQLFRLAC
jgi:DNA topoisomerase-1